MSAAQTGRKKKGFHHKNLREDMIAVTRAEIAEKGSADVNIKALARKLGVTHVAIYRHFDGKAGVLAAVAERGFDELRAAQIAAKEAAGDAHLKALIDMGLVYIDFAAKNRNLYAFMFSYHSLPEAQRDVVSKPEVEQPFAVLDQIILCQKAGYLIEGDPLGIFGAIMCAPHGYAMLTSHGGAALGVDSFVLPEPKSLLELTLSPFRTEKIEDA